MTYRFILTSFALLSVQILIRAQYWDSVQYHRMESDTLISWIQYGPGNAGGMSFLRYHPNIPGWCYLGPDMGNNYQTEDNGKSWYTVKDFDGNGDFWRINDLYYSSLSDSFALAIESSRLWSSQDTGKSWQKVLHCPWYTQNLSGDDTRSWYYKVSALAIDPTDDETWFVGAGAFPRAQQQQPWLALNNATAQNPRSKDNYSGDEHQGKIWRTENAGASWTTLTTGLHPDAQFSRIIVHPENRDLVFAASNYGLYRSLNRGLSWSNIGEGKLPNNIILDMDFYYDETTGKFALYLADLVFYYPEGQSTRNTGGIYRSDDEGDSWTSMNGNLYLDLNELSGGVEEYYFKYIANWFQITESQARERYPVPPDSALQRFSSVIPDPTDPQTLYVGFWEPQLQFSVLPGRLWKTTDAGQHWISVARNYAPAWEKDSSFWNSRNNPIHDNMEEGHYPCDLQIGSMYPLRSLRTCVVDGRGDLMMLTLHQTYLSTDGGDSWKQTDETRTPAGNLMGHGNSDLPGERILQDKRLGPGFTYLASGEHKLWRTTADGEPGRPSVKFYKHATETVSTLALHPWEKKTVFTASMRQHNMDKFMRSLDGGENWHVWGEATPAEEYMRTNSLLIDPLRPDYMYFGINDNKNADYDKIPGFYRSSDGGKTFAPFNSGLPQQAWLVELAFDPRDSSYTSLFAAVQYNYDRKIRGGLFHTSNRGENWTRVSIPSNIEGVNAVVFDHSGRLYLTAGRRHGAYDNGGAWYSDNYGQSWTRIFRNTWSSIFAVSPFDRNRLICINGTLSKNPGVFLSEDRGLSWSKNNRINGQPHNITDVEFDLYDPTTVHLTVLGSGFYRGSYPGGAESRKISLGMDAAELDIYGTLQLSLEAWGGVEASELVLSSSNASVATISSDAMITAHRQGAVIIRAVSADGRYTDHLYLTVSDQVTDNVVISPEDTTILMGDTLVLDITLKKGVDPEALLFESADSTVVDVDGAGNFIARMIGRTEVSVWSGDRIFSDRCTVTVEDSLGRRVIIMQDSIQLYTGDTIRLQVARDPDIREVSLTYQSADPSLVSVSSSGLLRGVKEGVSTVYSYVPSLPNALDHVAVRVYEKPAVGLESLWEPGGTEPYPNPVQQGNSFRVNLEGIQECRIYTLNGVLLGQFFVRDSEESEISTQNLAPGVYLVRILSAAGTVCHKLIVSPGL